MADLDANLLKNLDQTLKSMTTSLQNLETELKGVKSGMSAAFNPNIVTEFSNAVRGMKIGSLIDAEKSKSDIREIDNQIRILTQERKHGRAFTLFTDEEYNATVQKLASLRVEIEQLNNKARSKEGLSPKGSELREFYRQERDRLYAATRRGGFLGSELNPAQMNEVVNMLAKYKALQRDISVGDQMRAAQLANLQKQEEVTVQQGTKLGQVRAEQQERVHKIATSINRELERQQKIEQAIASIQERGGKSVMFEKKRRSVEDLNNLLDQSRRKVEGFERELSSLGTRGQDTKKAFGLGAAKEELNQLPTVFDRVIAQINQRAAQSKDKFAKQLVNAEGLRNEAKNAAAEVSHELNYIWRGSQAHLLDAWRSNTGYLTDFGRQDAVNQIRLSQEYKSNLDALKTQEVRDKLTQALTRYKDALQAVITLEEQQKRSAAQYSAQERAVEGVTRRFNENEQAIAKVRDRWDELNVKRQAGLVNEKDFKANTQKLLDEYDRLIAKRKEFETADIGQSLSERLRKQQEEEKRLEADRVRSAKETSKIITEERGKQALSSLVGSPKMNAAVQKQLEYMQQIRSIGKDINALQANKNRSAEENALLEKRKKELRDVLELQKRLNNEQGGSANLARQIDKYNQLRGKVKETTDEVKRQKTSLESMLPTLRRLASAFGVAFSVQGLVNFGKKLVETRGEFEMQFVAMKQIIGDVDAATKIWNQTMQQALQSPFKAMQLVDYTKKLAAYRIETDKLFDTTKRLADVSAGLGVDMQRLILAYGQVKAANFLRASEVRQFTEAGVNIYDNLANYFSEIEGRAVTVSEVIDRVTKRMVLFSDVEEIFKRMTDEGGVFFNMQEVQADTVRGQIMKLHDAYDQMLNTIGQANHGTLRNLTETANRLVRNWRDVAAFLEAQIPLFAVMIPYWISMRKIQRMTSEESALLTSRLATLKMSFISTTKSTKSATLALHEQRAAMMRQRKEMALNIERIKRLVKNKELLTRATRMWTRSMKTSMIQSAAFDTVLKSLIVSGEMLKTTLRSIAPFLAVEGVIFLINSLTSASRKAAEFKKELRELTDEQMGRGDEEANEYKRLVKEFGATNEGSIERAKVIQKINDKYGVYLDNLYNESSSLEDVANGYEIVAERAKEAARARALEEGYSKILGKYNQERSDSIFDLAKHPHGYTGGFGKAGTFISVAGTFVISKDDAKGFSEYVDEIVEKNEELYASMSQVERQKAIRQLYKDYFGKELPAGAAQLFNFIENTVDRLAALKDYEQSLEKDFNLKGLNKELRDRIIGIRDEAKDIISKIEESKQGGAIVLPLGMKLDIKKTRDDADTDVNSILTYIKRRVEEQSKQKEIDLRLSNGIIGEEEAKKLRGRIGRLTDETANQINDKIIKQIKEAYNVTGDLLDYIEKNPWDKNMGEMFAAINSGLITQNDIVQGIGKAEEVIQGRLQGQLSVLQDINKKKNSGLITDKAQLDELLKQERSVQTTYQWLQKTLFLLKNRAEVSEVQSALLDNTTIDKAKERVRKKFGENVAKDIKIGYAFDYANINMVQSAVADAYHKAGDEIDKEIKSIKASANADKEKIKMLERQRDIQYELANAYGYVDQKARSGGQKESVSRLISLIKEMRSEYDKLSKSAYGYAKSEEKVRASFGDSWEAILKEAGVPEDFDFSTNAGEIAALEKVRDYVKGNAKFAKDAWKDVQKVIDQLKTESEIEVQVRIREDFGRQMEEAFGNYELTLELQKLNLPADVAKDILGFDYNSLNDLLERTKKFRSDLENTIVGKDKHGNDIIENHFDEKDEEVYLSWMKKVEDKLFQMRKERAKEYTKYLEQELSERAKLEMQYVKDVAFVRANFNEGEQKTAIIDNLKKNYEQSLKELQWKSFKESDFYVEMMQDLTSMPSEYLDLMMQKLDEWAKKADVLSPRALKEVLKAREKVLAAQVALSPIRALGKSLRGIRDFQNETGRTDESGNQILISKNIKKSRNQLQGMMAVRAKNILKLQEELDLENQKLGTIKAQEEIQNTLNELTIKGVSGLKMTADADKDIESIDKLISKNTENLNALQQDGDLIQNKGETDEAFARRQRQYENEVKEIKAVIDLLVQLKTQRETAAAAGVDPTANLSASKMGTIANVNRLKKEISKLEKEQAGDEEIISKYKEWATAVHGLYQNISDVTSKVKELGNQLYETLETVGVETDEVTDAWKDFGNSMVDVILQALELIPTLVTGFTNAGVAINAAMGIIGLIALAIQAVLAIISGISKIHDARYEKEITTLQKRVDDLTDAHERLEKQIAKTWDAMSYIETYEDVLWSLQAQNEALEAQRNAELSKKKVDEERVADIDKQIRDNEEAAKEAAEQLTKDFGGIGESGYRDAAQGFVEAWKDAFLETGDGLQGLQDHFDEFLQDWFTKQATMLIARKYLDTLFDQIDAAVQKDGNGGVEVMWNEIQDAMDTATETFPAFSAKLEDFFRRFGGSGEGSLSGLAAGIQGMTEEQANILEAYWNSVRMYTASIDQNVAMIASALGVGGNSPSTNPMLQQMSLIAANTQATHQLLQSVTKSGHSLGGYGIKVFND